ncbi:hypothetical protein HYY75_00560 [bacterium]|nr:hypothetical protein [bacterium]
MEVEGSRCPFCAVSNSDNVKFCRRCLKAMAWPEKPRPSRPAFVVARTGIDAFIRGPNDGHPRNKSFDNSGDDAIGPIGTFFSPTGLRYLIRFDIEKAFSDARLSINDFFPEHVTLVLRTGNDEDAGENVPIVVFSLTRPFAEGTGEWGRHWRKDGGCNWIMASPDLSWKRPGGDFDEENWAKSELPRKGEHEIEIDVTELYKQKFESLKQTNRWEDFGMIILRNPKIYSKCRFRSIYGFQSSFDEKPFSYERAVKTPELYFE